MVSVPSQADDGLWCVAVHPGHADLLLAALDAAMSFVLIESWDGISDWHEAVVRIGADAEPRLRVVRRLSFDLLVAPSEAAEIGGQLRELGVAGGGLLCHQFRQRPHANFHMPDSGKARADAARGQGVELTIDLPHDGEVAVVSSPSEDNLKAYVRRLG